MQISSPAFTKTFLPTQLTTGLSTNPPLIRINIMTLNFILTNGNAVFATHCATHAIVWIVNISLFFFGDNFSTMTRDTHVSFVIVLSRWRSKSASFHCFPSTCIIVFFKVKTAEILFTNPTLDIPCALAHLQYERYLSEA